MDMKDRQKVGKFIDALKLYPCLWKTSASDYYDEHKRLEAFKRLIEVTAPCHKGADIPFIKKKILHLRTVFRRERRKVEESEHSGKVHVPSLWYYDRVAFLSEQGSPPRRRISDGECSSRLEAQTRRRFSSEEMKAFLDLYKDQHCLWDPNVEEYKDPRSRERAYRSLRQRFGEPLLTCEEIEAKIKGIRTTYSRELDKVVQSKRAASGSEEVYKPSLEWFDKADSFLRTVTLARGGLQGSEASRDFDPMEEGSDSRAARARKSAPTPQVDGPTTFAQTEAIPHMELTTPRRFSNYETLKFLDLYKKHQCLWNPRHLAYKVPQLRRRAIVDIIKNFGHPYLTYAEVKAKIKSIRTIYSREIAKVMQYKKSKVDVVYRPTLVWYEKADSFLRGVKLFRGGETVAENSHESDTCEDNFYEDSSTAPPDEPPGGPDEAEADRPESSSRATPPTKNSSDPKEYNIGQLESLVKGLPKSTDKTEERYILETNPEVYVEPPGNPHSITDDGFTAPTRHPTSEMMNHRPPLLDNNWVYGEEEGHEVEDNPPPEVLLGSRPVGSHADAHTPPRKRRKEDCLESILLLVKDRFQSLPERDRFDFAAKNWACKLREVGREQQVYAEKLINDILFEAQLGNLNGSYKVQSCDSNLGYGNPVHSTVPPQQGILIPISAYARSTYGTPYQARPPQQKYSPRK